ncbi:hypothetical protein VTJ04DRAFT_3416 [Mycothermus thermophilus]|uniref:uncharacterized protein n=1 Tax=Humicola insolens TaxID=85995 RepID=UPI00374282EC
MTHYTRRNHPRYHDDRTYTHSYIFSFSPRQGHAIPRGFPSKYYGWMGIGYGQRDMELYHFLWLDLELGGSARNWRFFWKVLGIFTVSKWHIRLV